MARSVLGDATTPYGAGEAWFFDTVIAPAIGTLRAKLLDTYVAELPPGARVLEVGSGGGQLALEVARTRPDLDWTGLDLSPAQVARATRRAAQAGVAGGVRFVQGSALELPFAEADFDAVVSIGSIKHWPDAARGLAECVRVLRPGAPLFVVEVDRGCRWGDARAFVDDWRMPRVLRPFGLMLFRTWVAGQAIDLDDARALLAGAGARLAEAHVERILGAPGLMMRGRAAGESMLARAAFAAGASVLSHGLFMAYRETALVDPDVDRRVVLAATEMGRRRNRLETFALVPFLALIGVLTFTGRWLVTIPVVALVTVGGRKLVRSRALAWADDLARIHGVPKERMRELARTIRFP